MKRIVLFLVLCCATGCGYTMSSRSDGSSGAPARLVISTVESRITPPRPELSYDLTRRLKEEAAIDARFVLSGAAGDVVTQIALTRYREPTVVSDFNNDPTEVTLMAEATVRINVHGEVRVAEVAAVGSFAPGLGEPAAVGRERLWRDLARNILDAIADRDWLAPEPTEAVPEPEKP
ncbi:MAG: hypothetical protein L6Q71_07450 [Planctomycetes bacterium]|nr:hypothetical protein [Planctomycetota bacterium]NUQ35489.1 hypothetical protein [Planctomycetaceae bacterium]